MTDDLTLTSHEVATLLKITPEKFQQKKSYLKRRGFPKPLPGFIQRWSAAQVKDWINDGGYTPTPRAGAKLPRTVAAQQALLHQRYGG